MNRNLSICIILFFSLNLLAQTNVPWGDQGNGTYINPVLNSDYSDPDVIRVGEKYYMVCSEFHFMGMTIQESDDMVNWKFAGRIYDSIPQPRYNKMEAYKNGSWAPALRYHDNKFWVFFCTPSDGLFMTNAENPEGPWTPLLLVEKIAKWEDPCPFWDDDDQAYLGRSAVGAGPIIIHKMSADGTKLLNQGDTVYTGPVAEGTKFLKRNGYYYLSIPEGGIRKGYQTVLRSKNIYGPYERKIVLETGSTEINGPHQGSLVETPQGDWWFYHFQWVNELGRVVHLQPVFWIDNWPRIGVDYDGNGVGEPVHVWKKPDVGINYPIHFPKTDDEFDSPELGLQWQWNHNPVNSKWSLSEKSGCLTLNALKADNLKNAHNTLTQKTMGYTGEAECKVDVSKMVDGQRSGLSFLSQEFFEVGVEKNNSKTTAYFMNNDGEKTEMNFSGKEIYLKLKIDLLNKNSQFYFSADTINFTAIGKPFEMYWGNWKGPKIGLFNYNTIAAEGKTSFDYFKYKYR